MNNSTNEFQNNTEPGIHEILDPAALQTAIVKIVDTTSELFRATSDDCVAKFKEFCSLNEVVTNVSSKSQGN